VHGVDAIIGPGKVINAIELPSRSGHLQHAVHTIAIKKSEAGLRLLYNVSQLVIRICPPMPFVVDSTVSMFDIHGHHYEDDKIKCQAEKDLVQLLAVLKEQQKFLRTIESRSRRRDFCEHLQQVSGIDTVHVAMHELWQPLRYISDLRSCGYGLSKIMSTFLEVVLRTNCRKLEIASDETLLKCRELTAAAHAGLLRGANKTITMLDLRITTAT